MNKRLLSIAEQTLFALLIFILVLIFAGSKFEVPTWLQPIGRMHPLLLHFPIVLLLLAMLLECFRFRPAYRDTSLYQQFTHTLLLSGVLLSAITVVMGLFLASEDGYAGDTLDWHKWTGIFVVYFTSIVYWLRIKKWYNVLATRVASVVVTISLLLTGHFGATLTHGENFVLAPLQVYNQVSLEEAKIFDHVVQPILTAKCSSCHNSEKAKGDLVLEGAEAITKGGKTGALYTAGAPEKSLLIQRLLLPLEDEKHMAPKGKPQLTEQEIAILKLWIKDGAAIGKLVIDLPASDSLRIIASQTLQSTQSKEDKYAFAAADASVIAKLNNDYRVVSSMFSNSPALQVNLYNRDNYNQKELEELLEVKKQIVYLNLNNLPVKDDDLKVIQQFDNLRTLLLNSTDVSSAGLTYIQSLKNLKEVSLFNTQIKEEDLKQLSASNPHIKIKGIN